MKKPKKTAAAPPAPSRTSQWRKLEGVLAAMDLADEAAKVNPFERVPPPKGMIPEGKSLMAMDDTFSGIVNWAPTTNQGQGEGLAWLGFPYLAELAQRPEYRVVSDTMAKEMTRKWIRVTSNDDDEDKSDKITELNKALEQLHLRDKFRDAILHDGFFGRGHIYPDFGASDAENTTPLKIDKAKIKVGSLKGFNVVEPVWVYPGNYGTTNPLSADFYRPSDWYVFGRTLSASRLLTIVSKPMPDLLKPGYAFAGMSRSQQLKPYVDNWIRTRQSVSDLIKSFSIFNLATNMDGMLANPTQMLNRLAALVKGRDNRGFFLFDKDTEAFANTSAPLSGLDKLQAQALEQIAAVAGIPLVILLGVTPSGLNASSDGEIRTFYDRVKSEQEDVVRDPLKEAIDIVQLYLWGEIDEAIVFDFAPLWELDEAGAALVDKTNADADAVRIDSGVIEAAEARKVIASDPRNRYPGLDADDIPEPPEDEEAPPTGAGDPAKGAEPREQLRSGV